MFHILGFLFTLILAILIIGLGIIATLVRNLFGHRRNPYTHQSYGASSQADACAHVKDTASSSSPSGKKKLFAPDEGEYVDFEEVV